MIKYIVFLFLCATFFGILAFMGMNDKVVCLDTGVCKAGLHVVINGQEILVNENSCSKNNGQWNVDKKHCAFNR